MSTIRARTATEPLATPITTPGETACCESVLTTIIGGTDGVGCGVVEDGAATTSLLLGLLVVVVVAAGGVTRGDGEEDGS